MKIIPNKPNTPTKAIISKIKLPSYNIGIGNIIIQADIFRYNRLIKRIRKIILIDNSYPKSIFCLEN